MATDYRIGMLWMEGPLSFLEQLCVASFRDAGHHVVLYHYGEVTGVPEGIEMADAETILPRTNFLAHERTGSPALHSDLFRYHMLDKTGDMIWADTDAYCVKRFETPNGHFYGWESKHHVNGGVLGLPRDSETLRELLEFTTDEFAIPDWFDKETKAKYVAAREAGNPIHCSEMPWGVWGPHAVTHFLAKTGEIRFALPRRGLYPFSFKERLKMLKPGLDVTPYIFDDTFSVHFYGRRMRRRLVTSETGIPHPNSLIGRLLTKHGIDPLLAPIPNKPPKPEAVDEDEDRDDDSGAVASVTVPAVPPVTGTARPSLADLCEAAGSDRGPRKHRFTDLYELLLQPYRDQPITLIEVGQDAAPARGKKLPQPETAVWRDYFSQAQIIGLTPGDMSAHAGARLRFHTVDATSREALRAVAAELPVVDVVIDDGSHASHEQQFAFVELFGRLRSGGMYIIEDLRWQPDSERSGFTKTAEVFQSWLDNHAFDHARGDIKAALNALSDQIAGVFMFQAHYRKTNRDQIVVIHKR